MAPAMSEAASPIGIANVSLFSCASKEPAKHVPLGLASESEVHTLDTSKKHNPARLIGVQAQNRC